MKNLAGCHVSTKGGLINGLKNGNNLGVFNIQLFSNTPHSYKIRQLSSFDIKEFNINFNKFKFNNLFIHAKYLLNLVSDDELIVNKSIESIVNDMNLSNDICAKGVVIHIGTNLLDFNKVKNKLKENILKILSQTPINIKLILENSAGRKNSIGKNINELIEIVKDVKSQRIQICLDTQHLYASGLEFTNYELNKLLHDIDKAIGINRISLIHINDSKTLCGSLVDRHENLGKGKIGINGLSEFIKIFSKYNFPFILETPGINNNGPDKYNVELLLSLLNKYE